MKLSEYLGLPLPCGGAGRCGRCKVTVSGQLSPLTNAEKSLLTQEELDAHVRLACQVEIQGDFWLHAAEEERLSVQLDFPPLPEDIVTSPASSKSIGVVVDIGTTTLAAYWYDLSTGQLIKRQAAANPQRLFGADVISRLSHAQNGKAMQLTACLRQAVAGLLPDRYDRLVLTGNTVMLYFLCGYDTAELATAPFTVSHHFGKQFDNVIIPPCFSAYVGADLATGALAAGFHKKTEKPALLLDIGTNGEMLLASQGKFFGASAAAGPAFEGGQISCGLPSIQGAICHVDTDLSYKTVDGSAAKGYCGSGILDITAALLSEGCLTENGYLVKWPSASLPELTQQDIREIQLAKSAIRAGCEALLKTGGADLPDTLYLAGGFGSQLRPGSARRIGLLPPALKHIALGNAAARGAAMLLLNPSLLSDLNALAKRFTLVELANDPFFSDAFMRFMAFPSGNPSDT